MIGDAFFASRKCEALPEEMDSIPNQPAVFLLWAAEGAPYLARTALLRRRLARLLRERATPSRLLNLRGVARRIEYWLCASRLESNLLFYRLARLHFPENYLKIVKLRMPAYLKVTLANPFPRTQVTARLAGGGAFWYGPFRTRASAEQFETQVLDLFQVRRCQENLEPAADHPGCVYGEMSMCLRPCQLVVSAEEYAGEVHRLTQFLATGGASLLESVAAARDRFSDELDFEQAARQHKRYERIQQVLALRDDLAADIDRVSGVAVTPAAPGACDAVTLWFFIEGLWAEPIEFPLAAPGGKIVSMDHRLRESVSAVDRPRATISERQEQLALLAKWFYSSWRDGEWLAFDSLERVPYRKIVNAISRTARH
jgi:excinuclease ABC subunit C